MFLQALEGPSLLKMAINQSEAPSSVCAELQHQEKPDSTELNISAERLKLLQMFVRRM